MGKEFTYITGDNVGEDQKARLSYLTRYWDELPNFYEEGGRGASGFFANLGVGLLDPLNVVGVGVGGIVSKGVLKKAGQEVSVDLADPNNPTTVKQWIPTGSRWLDSIICRGKLAGIPVGKV